VLHGCLQFVLLRVRLVPQTNEIPMFNLNLNMICDREVTTFGAKASRYGPSWTRAIDVPQRLYQCEAIPSHCRLLLIFIIIYYKKENWAFNNIKIILI
jgi:hypothetical protein